LPRSPSESACACSHWLQWKSQIDVVLPSALLSPPVTPGDARFS
jgi:hypothetical protein